jgi:4-hydroxybenzoate polyprenyltransferase
VGEALLTVLAVAAYGFVLNDLTDIEADRLSGQPNRMAGLGTPARAVALTLPLAVALAMAALSHDRVTTALTLGNLLLPTLYSIPPVRLKGRGLSGALADACGVHVLPMALVAWAVTRGANEHAELVPAFLAAAIGWTAMLGMRGIIVHQAQGLTGDQAAQVQTYVATIGRERARRLVWQWIVPAELVANLVFLVVVLPHAPVLLVALVVFALAEARQLQLGWTLPLFDPPGRSTEPYRPLVNNAWYELWMPVALALDLALLAPWGWLVVAGHLVLFRAPITERIRALLPIVQGSLVPPATAHREWQTHVPRASPDAEALRGVSVFVTAPVWIASGLTYWAGDLVRGLRQAGVEATLVLTEESTPLVTIDAPRMTRPADIAVRELPVTRSDNWGARWAGLWRLVERNSPAILVVTNDWRHSTALPLLGPDVAVIGVVHWPDVMYDEQVQRLRDTWDLLVGGSPVVSSHLHHLVPELHDRIATIPHGAQVPTEPEREVDVDAQVAGLLILGWGPEARDVASQAIAALPDGGAAYHITLLDPAEDTPVPGGARVVRIPNRAEWASLCRTHHVLLTFDWHADRRRQVVEAMGHGMIPIVWGDDPGDAPFRDGTSGHAVRNAAGTLATLLARLCDPAQRRSASERARTEVVGRHYSIDQMVDAFIDRMAWVHQRRRSRASQPKVSPPPAMVGEHRIFAAPFPVTTEWGPFPDEESVAELGRPWPMADSAEPS